MTLYLTRSINLSLLTNNPNKVGAKEVVLSFRRKYHIVSPKYHSTMTPAVGQDVLNTQHESLDATDTHASAWTTALEEAHNYNSNNDGPIKVSWGGRGKGGRGTARRTFQPLDIVVDVSLFFRLLLSLAFFCVTLDLIYSFNFLDCLLMNTRINRM